MTFILNILHNDFSILLADKRAQTEGPVTVTVGETTINIRPTPGGRVTIDGFQKIALNKSVSLSVGYAGTAGDHTAYLEKIKREDGIDSCLSIIMDAITSKCLPDRSPLLANRSFKQQQGIATFFDPAISTYFSLRYDFCEAKALLLWFTGSGKGARLIHVGSGSAHFEKAIGKEEIENFATSFTSLDSLDTKLRWLKDAFEKVSAVDCDVGKEFVAFISTRTNPRFQPLS